MPGTPKARNLLVTSPHMTGKDVTVAQQHLRKNVFKQDFMQGFAVDGDFGPDTGRACKRAKYWLGYATKDMDPTYGPYLAKFLIGSVKLPPTQQKLREQRLKKQTAKPLREKAFEKAVADLGMKESPPNSNRCPISNAWGMAGPWCAMAVSTWYLEAGSKAFKMKVNYAYVPYLLADGIEGKNGLAAAALDHVVHGDIVCFDWEQNGVADHTGLFDAWIDPHRTFKTIEGNTAVGNDSNGGRVMRRERNVSQVARHRGRLGFIHVGR